MQAQDELYRPTIFWNEASSRIFAELVSAGVKRFRSLETALGFFVPTSGTPGGGISAEQAMGLLDWLKVEFPNNTKAQLSVNHFLSGRMSALADYRVLKAADDPSCLPYLHTFSESKFGQPVEHFEFDGRWLPLFFFFIF